MHKYLRQKPSKTKHSLCRSLKKAGRKSIEFNILIFIGVFIFSPTSVSKNKPKPAICEKSMLTEPPESHIIQTDWKWDDAKATVQEFGIKTRAELIIAIRSGDLPEDFPTKIDEDFEEFTSWNDFFGNTTPKAIKNNRQKPGNGRQKQANKNGDQKPISNTDDVRAETFDEDTNQVLTEIGLDALGANGAYYEE